MTMVITEAQSTQSSSLIVTLGEKGNVTTATSRSLMKDQANVTITVNCLMTTSFECNQENGQCAQ